MPVAAQRLPAVASTGAFADRQGGMTMSASLQETVAGDVQAREARLSTYRAPDQVARVHEASFTGASAHAGHTRNSSQTYITHTVAVTPTPDDLGINAETI